MSVTTLLRMNKDRCIAVDRNIAASLSVVSLGQGYSAPPTSYRSRDWAIAGGTFDFWLRLMLWVDDGGDVPASECLTRALSVLDRYAGMPEAEEYFGEWLRSFPAGWPYRSLRELRSLAFCVRDRAWWTQLRHQHEQEASIRMIVYLSMLEFFGRTGELVTLSTNAILHDIGALEARAMATSSLWPQKSVCLNPQFASAKRVGGGDGDVIVDDVLVEVKCTKERVPALACVQLAAYDYFAKRDGTRLEGLSLYSARYGFHARLDGAAVQAVTPILDDLMRNVA